MDRLEFMKAFFSKKKAKVSIADFDKYATEDVTEGIERAKRFLGFEAHDINAYAPIVTVFPESLAREVNTLYLYQDGEVRYDINRLSILFFGEGGFYFYTALIDHKKGIFYNDKAIEMPYIQINGVQSAYYFKNKNQVNYHIFELTIILEGLKDIVIPIKYDLINAQTPDIFYDLDQESLDLVTNLRKFLRDKI
ncbi:MAG: hypothetical protein M0Q00_05750 [Acholeplasmataceae bacterium]|nr:hypothetical protein [Acholeplasmataceae bacterium]